MAQAFYKEGTRVRGRYHLVEFTGVVTLCRPHTLNSSIEHHVRLDAPIWVYGTERDSLLFSVPNSDPADWIDVDVDQGT